MSWIYSFHTEPMMAQIVSHTSVFAIWEALECKYATSSTTKLIELKTQLQNIKKWGMTVNEYIFKIRKLKDKLASIGEPATAKDQLVYLFYC